MNKEPIGLYIFRFFMGATILALMGMLYWSSTLMENDLKVLRTDMGQLKNDFFDLRTEIQKNRGNVSLSSTSTSSSSQDSRNQVVYSESNILHPDAFYDDVLPKLLGPGFVPHGVRRMATISKPDNLHPFAGYVDVSGWTALCNVTLSELEFGKYETMTPNMAVKIEERYNLEKEMFEFWVYLRDDAYWQPLRPEFFSSDIRLSPHFLKKHQVTAYDFKFYYDAIMNPFVESAGAVALRTYYLGVQEFEVIDKFTFVVRWKVEMFKEADGNTTPRVQYIAKQLTGGLKPLCCDVYQYFPNGKKIVEDDSNPDTYRKNSVWAQNFYTHWAKNVIVSCGAWIFDGMTERQIKFKRNPDFYFPDAALTKAIEVDFKDSPANVWQAFKNGQLDSYSLLPTQLNEYDDFMKSDVYQKQVATHLAIKKLEYLNSSYTYIGWNAATPYFGSAKVRRAMTMAIDRHRIIEQNLNGLGVEITGTFFRYSPAYDESIVPLPFSPQQARLLLEEEGWYDSNGDGIIDKLINGTREPFSFTLTYYVKNQVQKSIAEYLVNALKEVGIECRLNGVDVADLTSSLENKSFDAMCMAWSLGLPPENPRQLWSSAGAKEKGSSNIVGFANAEIDKLIDLLDYESDKQKRVELYHQFDRILYDEQPYTFLYSPKAIYLYREYLQNVFIPAERQDLIPEANIAEPNTSIFWIKEKQEK